VKSEPQPELGKVSLAQLEIQVLPMADVVDSSVVSEWDNLVIQTGTNPSFSFAWMMIIAESHKLFHDVEVFLIRSDDRLVCVIPFFSQQGTKIWNTGKDGQSII